MLEQHPVPQNVTSFQFRLIGDMTLKQFGYLAGGAVLAYISYNLPLPFFFRYPLAAIFGLGGIGFAFVPVEERPMDVWFVSFIRSIYSPTQYIWQREDPKIPPLSATNTQNPTKSAAGPLGGMVPSILPMDQLNKLGALITNQANKMTGSPRGGAPAPVQPAAAKQSVVGGPPPIPQSHQTAPPIKKTPEDNKPRSAATAASSRPTMQTVVVPYVPEKTTTAQPKPPTFVTEQVHPNIQNQSAVGLPSVKKPGQATPPYNSPSTGVQPTQPPAVEASGPKPFVQQHTTQPFIQHQTQSPVHLGDTKPPVTPSLVAVPTPSQTRNPYEEQVKQMEAKLKQYEEDRKKLAELEAKLSQANQEKEQLKQQVQKVFSHPQQAAPHPVPPQIKSTPSVAQPPSPQRPSVSVFTPQAARSAGIPTITTFANVVSGIVRERSGNLIVGILVTVKDKDDVPVRALKTNKLGQFAASTPLTNGTYTIEVEDPKKQYFFDQARVILQGTVLPPLEIIAKTQQELDRAKLEQAVFGKKDIT